MHTTVCANGDTIHVEPGEAWCDDRIRLDFAVQLPLLLEIWVTGKHLHDTEVGSGGEILQDKCVIIDHMAIGGIWLKKWYLESQAFEFCDDAQQRRTNYLGQNGVARFQIASQDLLDFWLDTLCVDG